jgi:hypothetical protein
MDMRRSVLTGNPQPLAFFGLFLYIMEIRINIPRDRATKNRIICREEAAWPERERLK